MSFKEFILIINEDLEFHAGTSFLNKIIVFFFNMPYRLALNYRTGNFLVSRKKKIWSLAILMLKKRQIKRYNCDISYNAIIGKRIKFPHPISIVIGENSKIGNDVMIWHEVTLGSHGRQGQITSYPTIEDKVKLFSGCKLIGGITIEKRALVGANAVVIDNVSRGAVVVGIPAAKIKK